MAHYCFRDNFCVQGQASAIGQGGCAKMYTVQSGDTCCKWLYYQYEWELQYWKGAHMVWIVIATIVSKAGGYFNGLVGLNSQIINSQCSNLQVRFDSQTESKILHNISQLYL